MSVGLSFLQLVGDYHKWLLYGEGTRNQHVIRSLKIAAHCSLPRDNGLNPGVNRTQQPTLEPRWYPPSCAVKSGPRRRRRP